MALPSAVMVGMIAAIGVPYVMADLDNEFGRFIRETSIRIPIGDTPVLWSWTPFAIVTLFAWGFFAWAQK